MELQDKKMGVEEVGEAAGQKDARKYPSDKER